MGDPKLTKKKFSAPPHPWQKSRIEEERQLIREYGLKNKSEVWKMRTKSKNFADQAKRLTAQDTPQSKKEEEQLLSKLYRYSLLPKGASIDEVLGLITKDIMERRLQTIVFKKGLAKSMKQARQFIAHRHIVLGKKVVTAPSYLVSAAEEGTVAFIPKSALSDAEHPERAVRKEVPGEKPKKAKKEKAKKEETKTKKEEPKEKKKEAKPKEEKPKKEEKQEKDEKEPEHSEKKEKQEPAKKEKKE